jgi:DNA-binding NtrC family response regulator
MAIHALVVDDDPDIREPLCSALGREGYVCAECGTGEEAVSALGSRQVDMLFLDLGLPGMSGEEVLRRVVARDGPITIVLTGQADVKKAVECIRAGAYDYMVKPFNLDALLVAARRAAEHIRTREQAELLRRGGGGRYGEMIGESPAMEKVYALVRRAAEAPDTTALIMGESGTGKELVARAVHRESARARAPFVAVNCTAVQENLLESEFFGHERGAFTDAREAKKGLLEVADGGSILLDEIGDMTPALQAKLLRFLEDRSFRRLGGTRTLHSDVRILASTNRDLDRAVTDGSFRQDLFFRLNVLRIELPPLRRRSGDIPVLARHLLEEFSARGGGAARRFHPAALEALAAYDWPGNVRELRNVIERIVIVEDAREIGLRHLPREIVPRADGEGEPLDVSLTELPYTEAKSVFLDSFTRRYVTALLEANEGNVSRSARQARMDRANFQRLMRRVGVSSAEYAADEAN